MAAQANLTTSCPSTTAPSSRANVSLISSSLATFLSNLLVRVSPPVPKLNRIYDDRDCHVDLSEDLGLATDHCILLVFDSYMDCIFTQGYFICVLNSFEP